jgi:hypothetical protein
MTLTPPIPLYSDTVNISAEIFQLFLAPSNITLTAYYATATNYAALASASPHAISMSCIASNPATLGQWYKFKTTSPIPTNATDTFVKYYVQASYSGYQASSTSPKTFTTFENFPTWYAPMEQVYDTNQAFYVVYSCAPGAVWINEITPVDGDGLNTYYFTNQYIELCGPNGADIHNWTIEIVDQDEVPVELYTVTNNPSLHPPQAYGYGFWLLGVTNVPGIDQVLTTDAPDPSWLESVVVIGPRKMPIAGGIKLRRSWGPVEYAIFYNTDPSMVPSGYTAIGFHPDTSLSGGLGLTGSGSNYTAFSWAELASATAGSINSGQIFLGETPPVVYIYSVRVNTNVWLECTRTTNWHTLPWYTTNLLSSNSWSVIPLFTRTSSGTNDMLYFSRSTNSTTYFYKVVATNSPW